MIDKNDDLAYYVQIYNILRERIEKRIYIPNSLLPSESELAEEFNVTRITVRNALKRLKEEDRIYTEKGKGSFVKVPSVEHSLFKFYSFGRNYAERDFQTETIVVDKKVGFCNDDIKSKLKLEVDEEIFRIVRLRKIEYNPAILEFSYIPLRLAPNILEYDLGSSSIYDLLEHKYGLRIVKAKEYLNPDITEEYESKLLEVGKRTPVFVTERTTYTYDALSIEYRRSIIRSDRLKFFVDLY